jgi:hypothetical protein
MHPPAGFSCSLPLIVAGVLLEQLRHRDRAGVEEYMYMDTKTIATAAVSTMAFGAALAFYFHTEQKYLQKQQRY